VPSLDHPARPSARTRVTLRNTRPRPGGGVIGEALAGATIAPLAAVIKVLPVISRSKTWRPVCRVACARLFRFRASATCTTAALESQSDSASGNRAATMNSTNSRLPNRLPRNRRSALGVGMAGP
jgi:hypothetical protein